MDNRNDSHSRQPSENRNDGHSSCFLGVFALVLALFLGACGTGSTSGPLSIVVSTSILGDVVRQIVGDDANVEVLMPIGASPHDFAPSARQVASMADADLVVLNGLGLEEALIDVAESLAGDGGDVLLLGPLLDPLPLAGENQFDPHVWMDPSRMLQAVDLIEQRLAELEPDGPWESRGDAYQAQLADLDATIESLIGSIPPERRFMVTNHASLEYFTRRYGLEVVGTVIPGTSSTAAPSAADLADLSRVIDETNTSVIFAETSEPERLAQAIAEESDRAISVVTLYTESLGEEDSPAGTYIGMMLADAELITSALSGTAN